MDVATVGCSRKREPRPPTLRPGLTTFGRSDGGGRAKALHCLVGRCSAHFIQPRPSSGAQGFALLDGLHCGGIARLRPALGNKFPNGGCFVFVSADAHFAGARCCFATRLRSSALQPSAARLAPSPNGLRPWVRSLRRHGVHAQTLQPCGDLTVASGPGSVAGCIVFSECLECLQCRRFDRGTLSPRLRPRQGLRSRAACQQSWSLRDP